VISPYITRFRWRRFYVNEELVYHVEDCLNAEVAATLREASWHFAGRIRRHKDCTWS